MQEGEELVVGAVQPLDRGANSSSPSGTRASGCAMDTLRDRACSKRCVEKGNMPWRMHGKQAARSEVVADQMLPLKLPSRRRVAVASFALAPTPTISRSVRARTILHWMAIAAVKLNIHLVRLQRRRRAAKARQRSRREAFLQAAETSSVEVIDVPRRLFSQPEGEQIKGWFEAAQGQDTTRSRS